MNAVLSSPVVEFPAVAVSAPNEKNRSEGEVPDHPSPPAPPGEREEEEHVGNGLHVSERDREIYEAICLEGVAVREMAAACSLSATTVRNTAQRVQRELARRQNALERLTSREVLVLQIDRLERQWSEALQAWRMSKISKETTFTRNQGSEQQTTDVRRVSQTGDVRYLSEARRTLKELTAAQVQLEAYDRKADYEAELARQEAGRAARQAQRREEQAARRAREEAEIREKVQRMKGVTFGPRVAKGVSAPPQGASAKGVVASDLGDGRKNGHVKNVPHTGELSDPEFRALLKQQMAEKLGTKLTPELEAELEADLDLMLEMERKKAKPKAR